MLVYAVQVILQNIYFGQMCFQPVSAINNRATEGTRTPDPLITNELLYQLSYGGNFVNDR